MYIVREILNCKPGKVRQMIENFEAISAALRGMGRQPLRLMTDVSGEPFWTLVVEASVETVNEFFENGENGDGRRVRSEADGRVSRVGPERTT